MKDTDAQRPEEEFYLLSQDLVDRINNITLGDFDGWIDVCEDLSRHFSLIPIYRLNKDKDRCKAPINPDWSDCCYERSLFDKSDFVANNSGIACGPASGVIVLNIHDSLLFQDFLAEKGCELRDDTFIVEAGDGTRQYYYHYPKDGCKYSTRPAKKTITDEYGVEKNVTVFEIIGCDGYTLAPGSIDPFTFKHSKVVSNQRIAEAPAWLLDICRYEKIRLAAQQDIKVIQPEGVEGVENSPEFNESNNSCADELSDSPLNAAPQERFKKHFDNLVGWGIDKNISTWTNPTEAFEKSNYLAFPQSRRQYLCLDLDWEGSGTIWMDGGLPEPTITFINRENGHSNLAYELITPVIWPCEYNSYNVRPLPIKYFKAIRNGFNVKTEADCGYTNSTIKNPFSNLWRVTWADKRYDLSYLAEFVTLPAFSDPYAKLKSGAYEGRNDELFYLGLRWSYRNVKRYENHEEFYNALLEFIKLENLTTIVNNWPQRGYLPAPEVTGIAKGVSKYTWIRKNSVDLKHLIKNFGILGFPPIDANMNLRDRKMEVYSRQYKGSKYTHKIVSQDSVLKIDETIESLVRANKKVSYNKISKTSGLSYNTILKYKQYVNNKIEFLEKVF